MALQSIQQTVEASATYSIDPEKFGIGRQGEDNYLAYFDPGDDQNYVLRNCGLTLGAVKPTDPGQVLMSLSAKCGGQVSSIIPNRQGAIGWLITAHFSQWNFSFGDPSNIGDPLAMATRWELDYERMPEPALRDVNTGKPILNSASDPFDPPIQQSGLIHRLTVRRNERYPDFGTLFGLADTLNTAEWNGIPAKWAKFSPPRIPQREWSQDGGYYFWPMTYEFEINKRTWQAKPPNLGFNAIVGGKKTLITDDTGQPLQQPGLLDTDGTYIKPPVPDNKVITLKFDIYRDVDWSGLNLDDLPDFTFTAPPEDDDNEPSGNSPGA